MWSVNRVIADYLILHCSQTQVDRAKNQHKIGIFTAFNLTVFVSHNRCVT